MSCFFPTEIQPDFGAVGEPWTQGWAVGGKQQWNQDLLLVLEGRWQPGADSRVEEVASSFLDSPEFSYDAGLRVQ